MLPPYLREAREHGEAAQAARPGERKPGGTPSDAAKVERARTAEVAAPASGPATDGAPAPGLGSRAKGKAGARARHGKLERLAAAEPIRPAIAAAPVPQTGGMAIGRDRLQVPSTDASFETPMEPRFRPVPRADAKAETASIEQVRAVETFRVAMQAARQLHDGLVADARAMVARAVAGADQLATRRQDELDQSLAGLDDGLSAALTLFDGLADVVADLVDQGERQTKGSIHSTASSAFGALNGAKSKAGTTFNTHVRGKDKAKGEADAAAATVTTAGSTASVTVLALDQTKEKDHPTTIAAMDSAVNEAINVRLPTRTPARAKTYTDEATAEFTQLTATFGSMKSEIEKRFTEIAGQMAKTADTATSSITKARDQALSQLAETAAQLRTSIDETRASQHAALVRQHDLSRNQLLAAWRERGRSEDQSAQQRATRGANAALALASGQQAGAKSLADSLDKEKGRPPDDFAKVVRSSAGALVAHIGKSGAEQRTRVTRSAEAGETGAVRQAESTRQRLADTTRQMVGRLDEAGRGAGTSLTRQIERSVESFDRFPTPIVQALGSALPSARKGYDAENGQAEKNVTQANTLVTNAMSGKGDGDGKKDEAQTQTQTQTQTADASGQKGAKAREIPNDFVARAKKIADNANTDDGIAELLSTAKDKVPPIIRQKADSVHGALVAFSTPVLSVMEQLRNITALQGAAISDVYDRHFHLNLEAHLRSELWKTFSADSTNEYNIDAAINYLHGNHVAAALAEMKAAVNYSNDEGRVAAIQRSLTPAELEQLRTEHPEEYKDVIEDLGGTDRKVSEALNRIKPVDPRSPDAAARAKENLAALGEANAYELQRDLDRAREKKRGEEGGDATADMLAGKRQSIGSDVLSGGDALDAAFEDKKEAQARRESLWGATVEGFDKVVTTLPDGSPNVAQPGDKAPPGAIARYAAAARNYEEFVPDNSEMGGHIETVSQGLDPRQTHLIDALVKFPPDSEEVAAATLNVELNRESGKPKEDRLRKALGSDLLAAQEGESDAARKKRLEATVDAQGKVLDPGDLARAKARRDTILLKYAALTSGGPQQQPGQPAPDGAQDVSTIRDGIVRRLGDQLAFDPTAKAYTQSMVQNLEPDPGTAFDFALAHEEKNKETLQATAARLNPDEIDKAVKQWDANHQSPPLYKRLGMFEHGSGVLEGDARNETEIKFMGVPRNDLERAQIANMAVKQQVRDSGFGGRTLASEEYQRMLATQTKLLGLMGVTEKDIDQYGRIKKTGADGQTIHANFDADGKLIVKSEGDRDEFAAAMQLSHLDAEGYKQAVDRAAMGVVMGLMVIAAAVTTFVTFGGAAAIWAPILITAGAGLAGIAMTAAIRGDRYTRAEIERDLVMTFVQAATAGLGAYAGTAMRGAGAAAKAAATSEKVVGGIAGIAEKETLTLGAKALQVGKEVVIDAAVGGTTNAVNSAAGAAMDPENRRQGKSGEKAFESGLKSFLGGAVGSTLTKPIGALAKPAGGMVSRVAGAAAGGFATRLTEARVGQAMGEPHQSWAESLDQAKEGIAQDVIQGAADHGAEHAAEHFAERRTKIRLENAARAGGEPPVPVATRIPEEAPLTPPRPAAPGEGPEHAPPSLTRAAAVREALPPDLVPAVDAAFPPKPGATEAIRPGADEAGLAASRRPPTDATGAEPVMERRPGMPPDEAPPGTRRPDDERAGEPTAASKATTQHADIPWAPADFLEGVVMMDENSHSRAEIEEAYRNSIAADASREVAIYRNPETGEHIMVFGDADTVFIGLNKNFGEAPHAAEPPGTRQDWKELLPKDVGRWELEAHYHPGIDGKHDVAPMARRLPSTGENGIGDFQVLRHESQAAGGGPRSSVIDFTHEGRPGHTVFGFDPDHPKPYWIDVENPSTGKREQHRFETPGEYEGWAQQHGAKPNRDVPGAPRGSPLPGATPLRDEELTLRHGTTAADAEAIRREGIDPHRKTGAEDDFSRGFYMTLDEANARYYAERRSGGAGGEVLATTIKLSELGLVVDVRESGEHRAQWDAFLDREPPAYPSWGAGLFKNAREFLTGTGSIRMNEIQRGVVFEAFLAEAGLSHADAVRGDLGRGLTTGIAAHSEGEQLAIRSKDLADKLNRRMGFGAAPQEEPPIPGSGRAKKPGPTAAGEGAGVEQAEAGSPGKTPATDTAASDAPATETGTSKRARERAARRKELDADLRGHDAEIDEAVVQRKAAEKEAAKLRPDLPPLPSELNEWHGGLPPELTKSGPGHETSTADERLSEYSKKLEEPGLSEAARDYLKKHRDYYDQLAEIGAANFGANQAALKKLRVQREIAALAGGRSAEEARKQITEDFRRPTQNAELEAAIAGLSPYGRAYIRQYEDAVAALAPFGVKPEHIVAGLTGLSDAAFGSAFRDRLRSGSVDVLRGTSRENVASVLEKLLDAQPNNSSKGALFHAFREARMPRGFSRVEPRESGTTIRGTTRMADGVIAVAAPPEHPGLGGPQKSGRYLAEDKAGSGAFDPDQARHYSSQMGPDGSIRTADGKTHNGVVYFFDTFGSARDAARYMDGNRLNTSLHVGYFDKTTGTVKWLR